MSQNANQQRSEHGVACQRAIRRRGRNASASAGPHARSAKAGQCFRQEYSACGRSALRVPRSYDTVPYCARPSLLIRYRIGQDFSLKRFFSYWSGAYCMQTLTTEKAHSCCELRLPAWTCDDPARLLQFHTDDLFYSDPPSEGAIGRNALTSRSRRIAPQSTGRGMDSRPQIPLRDDLLNQWGVWAPAEHDAMICHGIFGCPSALRSAGQVAPNSPIC
jgi:hypothetical protein